VDGFLAVETAVRFEIDRLFRERGIEISYPQMDLHVKTLVQPVAHAPIPANEDDPPPK
jgi:small-conductance mechanosensitive channel